MNYNDHNELPEGLGFSLALDLSAMTNFVNLSDAAKEEVVEYIKASETGDEALERTKSVVRKLHRGESVEAMIHNERYD